MPVLFLHPQQLQLVHGKVELLGAVVAALLAPQLVVDIGLPGALYCPWAAGEKPLAQVFGHGGRVTHHLYVMEVVLCLGASADDPGDLTQAQTPSDDQGVRGSGAVVVLVVELMSLEGVVRVENVGASQELWPWSHLTAETGKKDILLYYIWYYIISYILYYYRKKCNLIDLISRVCL